MELSRRDFMRNTAAFAAVASVLGTSGIAFAADADQNCLVKVDSPDRAELAKRFKAGSAAGVEYYAYNPRRYAPTPKGAPAPDRFPPRRGRRRSQRHPAYRQRRCYLLHF